DGALSLDDDIRKYLPEMPDYGKPISIRNLVQHSSGVREYTEVMYLRGVADEDT
ncbi:MAG: serine hydrolase, partial [Acidobacteria bacterium]|nr:serine hydrolase [Acidobacteriota bacterium]